jgi:hypothetical protein
MLTEKQNYLNLLKGEEPEWIPHYSPIPGPGKTPPVGNCGPSFLMEFLRKPGIQKDIWGVTNVPVPDAAGAKIPEPGNFILHDITKWRDVIKAPDISGYDWESIAKKDMEMTLTRVNRNETALGFGLHTGYFQAVMAFMGFTEGLCALYEEPEEVKALIEYMSDFYLEVCEKTIDLYKPDIFTVLDDTAAWKNPFFSVEMYRDIFKPFYVKFTKPAIERGLPIEMHNCGRCEDFIDDWKDFGVVSWNPAQISNNLDAVKKKHGNSMVINGGWDIVGELAREDVTEEIVKQSVYDTIRRYSAGGGYAFCGGYLGAEGDKEVLKKNTLMAEAVTEYNEKYYKK